MQSEKIQCYVCMVDHQELVETCGIESHRVCSDCRVKICTCPMCRAEIVPGDNASVDSYYSEHLPDPEAYYAQFGDPDVEDYDYSQTYMD